MITIKNVPRLLGKYIYDVMGFNAIEDLGKYLELPIFHKKVGFDTFKFVIDKVKHRLSTWKAITLSFLGRVTLAKSVVHIPCLLTSCNLVSYLEEFVMKDVSFGEMRRIKKIKEGSSS